MAFEVGHTINNGRAKTRHVYDGLIREVVQNPAKLKKALESILDQAANGDLSALDWIACRLEGKASQSTELSVTGSLVETLASIRMATLPPLPDIPALGRVIDHDTGDTDG